MIILPNIESNNYHWYHELTQHLPLDSIKHVMSMAQALIKKVQIASQEVFQQLQEQIKKTSLTPCISNVNKVAVDIEKAFNILGCTPFVCVLSGSLRAIFGKLQIIAGILTAALGELALFFCTKRGEDIELTKKWHTLSKLGAEHIIHGCLNTLRGNGEALLGSMTLGVGNIVLLIPNLSLNRNFSPFFAYGTLVNPLLTLDNPSNAQTLKASISIDMQTDMN
jgi:hypothetical protein